MEVLTLRNSDTGVFIHFVAAVANICKNMHAICAISAY
jgi:hypothetical protein